MTAVLPVVSAGAGPAERLGLVDRDGLTVIIVELWAYVVIPRLIQTLLSAKTRFGVGEPVAYSPLALVANQLIGAAVLGSCVVVIARRLNRVPTDRGWALVALLTPWVYIVCRDIYADQSFTRSELIFPLVTVAIWMIKPPLRRFALIGVLTATTAILSLVVAIADPAKGIFVGATGQTVDAEKAILPIGLLVGPLSSANDLGQVLILGLPFIWLLKGLRTKLFLSAITVFALVWTSSRSSLAALAVIAVVAILLAVPSTPVRVLTSAAAACAAGVAMIAVPLQVTDPGDFTNRGLIWLSSLDQWRSSPLLGLGSGWYRRAADYSVNPSLTSFHAHNQFVQILVTSGLIGLVLAGATTGYLLVLGIRRAVRGEAVPVVFLIGLLVSCTLEVSFGFVDREFLLSSAMLSAIAVACADRATRAPQR